MYHCDANLRRSCNASICSILKSTCFLDYSRIDTGLELPFKEKSVRLDTADIFKQQSFHEKASTKCEAAGVNFHLEILAQGKFPSGGKPQLKS